MSNDAARTTTRRRRTGPPLQDQRTEHHRPSDPPVEAAAPGPASVRVARDDHDVVLDVQKLRVDELDLSLQELKARVALDARVLDLLRLDVGVEAELRGVDLRIAGVDGQAL